MTPNPQNPSPGFPTQKRKTAGLSVLIALAATSGAYAQSTTTTTPPAPETVPAEETVMLETFEVRGQRGSAIKAIEVKRHDAQLVDSIVSEDIGKFPDNNVVESLQRLPGVQVKVEPFEEQPAAADQRQPVAVEQPHACSSSACMSSSDKPK